jgi:hypothetical protein
LVGCGELVAALTPDVSLTTQYGDDTSTPAARRLTISTANAQAASETLRQIPALTEEDIQRMVDAWRRTGFLQ